MEIGYLLLKIMLFFVFKMAAILKIIKLNLFLKSMPTHAHLTNVMLVCYATNHFVELFYEYCSFIRHYWKKKKKINILCELVTSQPHWFAGSQLDISKFSIANNFLVYCPICMKFVPNSLVLEILSFWLGFTVSDPFPLKLTYDFSINNSYVSIKYLK